MIHKKAQTSTEYLIIIAVVIMIGIILISVLGKVPSIGKDNSFNAQRLLLASEDIGVIDYSVTNVSTILKLKNNLPEIIKVLTIGINGSSCNGIYSYVSLGPDQERKITCSNINESEIGIIYDYPLWIRYNDSLQVTYNITMPNLLGTTGIGYVESGY